MGPVPNILTAAIYTTYEVFLVKFVISTTQQLKTPMNVELTKNLNS